MGLPAFHISCADFYSRDVADSWECGYPTFGRTWAEGSRGGTGFDSVFPFHGWTSSAAWVFGQTLGFCDFMERWGNAWVGRRSRDGSGGVGILSGSCPGDVLGAGSGRSSRAKIPLFFGMDFVIRGLGPTGPWSPASAFGAFSRTKPGPSDDGGFERKLTKLVE